MRNRQPQSQRHVERIEPDQELAAQGESLWQCCLQHGEHRLTAEQALPSAESTANRAFYLRWIGDAFIQQASFASGAATRFQQAAAATRDEAAAEHWRQREQEARTFSTEALQAGLTALRQRTPLVEELHGAHASETEWAYGDIARNCRSAGLWEEAEAALLRMLSLRETRFGPTSEATAYVLELLSDLYLQAGRSDDAATFADRAQVIRRRYGGFAR